MVGILLMMFVICSFLGLSYAYYKEAELTLQPCQAIYQGNTGKKLVALTVNVDWGEEFIPEMLETLKKHDSQATFFVTGIWAEKNPDLLKQMYDAGHSIQNHGYKHLHFNSISAEEVANQIKKAEEAIYKITGERSTFFAPPYGEHNQQVINVTEKLNYHLIMWSVDTIDWRRPNPDTIVKRVINKVHNDAIVLMHPTEPTVKALPQLLSSLSDQGYKMVSIKDIIDDKDDQSEKGNKPD